MRLLLPTLAVALLSAASAGLAATPVWAQTAPQAAQKTAKVSSITVTGLQNYPADPIVSSSGLKAGDVVSAQQIQDAADRLAALGIFSAVNFRFSSSADTISLQFQVKEAPVYPVSFDNFPWFTTDEIAQGIRQEVPIYNGKAPDGGVVVDAMTVAVENLLASKHVQGHVTHQLLAEPVGDGMIMQFQVDTPGMRIQSVQFGDSLATESEPLKDRIFDIKGQPYSQFAIDTFDAEHVRPLYAARGYLRAKIGPAQPKLVPDADDPKKMAVDIVIPIAPGAIYTFSGITWQGNSAIGSSNLEGAVEVKPGDAVDGMKMEALWQKVESAYSSHGYLDAKLPAEPEYDDAAHKVSYRVTIVEGEQYKMGQMIVTGLSVDAEKRLRQVWLLAAGQVFDNGYFESMEKQLAKPSTDIFGDIPLHYTVFGHWLRPDPEKQAVDVLFDFK